MYVLTINGKKHFPTEAAAKKACLSKNSCLGINHKTKEGYWYCGADWFRHIDNCVAWRKSMC